MSSHSQTSIKLSYLKQGKDRKETDFDFNRSFKFINQENSQSKKFKQIVMKRRVQQKEELISFYRNQLERRQQRHKQEIRTLKMQKQKKIKKMKHLIKKMRQRNSELTEQNQKDCKSPSKKQASDQLLTLLQNSDTMLLQSDCKNSSENFAQYFRQNLIL